MKSYFEVDLKGLRSLLGERDKSFLVDELVQNAWDENIVSKLTEKNLDLIIHELCHHYGHHTEIGYLRKIISLGAQLTLKALNEPGYFDEVKSDD